jgi:site-specific recombinase XerD
LWLADGEAAGWSKRTIASRQDMLAKFRWWLEQEGLPDGLDAIDAQAIRFFLVYLRKEPAGRRWNSRVANAARPARPLTVDTYYRCLRAFFNFAVREGQIAQTPMKNVRPPRVPKDQIATFTDEQAQTLLDAAKKSDQPARNTAIVALLLDTGMRVSELCQLRLGDFEPEVRKITITGKGGKRRDIHLSAAVRLALWRVAA